MKNIKLKLLIFITIKVTSCTCINKSFKNEKYMNPTMQIWTDAYHLGDAEKFKNIYTINGVVFPPNKPTQQGNEKILNFMKGGFGKVDVIFVPKEQIIKENIAFEYGVFQDKDFGADKIIAEGNYSVTWILENSVWKIQCHTWSMPVKL
ncbi:nuclear transport factor 2 family protein [Flavobacterium sp.]|uniref:nuclear transport factor 2 family protein n=1 Tax=Flavobacterium sp. TaxID=239 RepID=UPI002611133D|nr:nuclear transport factor 2 family protein [Flavobacterium sp.]